MARVCVDSTFFDVDTNGQLTFRRESVGLQQMIVRSTPGTFPFNKADFPGLTRLRVRVIGGGGGGASANAATGESVARAGGGGGGYSESVLNASDLGATETITVGAGGAGATSGSNGGADGEDGSPSSFGGFVRANGGAGSNATMVSGTFVNTQSGPTSAAPGTGQIRVAGGAGGGAVRLNGVSALGGAGGDSGGGYGQGGAQRADDNDGADGRGYGGGGGGAVSNGATHPGGNGAAGAVIIELYF